MLKQALCLMAAQLFSAGFLALAAGPEALPKVSASLRAAPAAVLNESFDEPTRTDFGTAVLGADQVHLARGKGVAGSNGIRVDYRGNARGSERVIVNYRLPPSLRYALQFDVNFCQGFDFAKGGKLHGLGPAHPVAGGNRVAAGRWSARAMFRAGGGLQTYVYSQHMDGRYGAGVIAKHFRFEPGRFYRLKYEVAVNNPAAESNGYMRLLINSEPVIEQRNIKFRTTDSLDSQISTLMFNTFHGGHTAAWAPRNKDGTYAVACAYFDNFSIYRLP